MCRFLTGIVQRGETPCVKFSTNVVKDASLLDDWGVGGDGFHHIPGCQVSRPTPHLRPPKNHASNSRYPFFAAYVRDTAKIGWGRHDNWYLDPT